MTLTEAKERAIRSDIEAGIRLSGNDALLLLAEIDALRAERDRLQALAWALSGGDPKSHQVFDALKEPRLITVAEAQLHGDPAVIRQAEFDALSGRTR